jgi:ornithine--oxo-acid transaminase
MRTLFLQHESPASEVPIAATSMDVTDAAYRRFVNPEWVRLLGLLGMNVKYRRCLGTELFAEDGRVLLDFLSGYCVHNTGHNHPYIVRALMEELAGNGPAMLQSHVSYSAGTLAERLTSLVGGQLTKVHFCSSGSEGVETVIKFARVFTGRTGFVYAQGAFHGLTCGALSLMGDPFWKDGFGPMLPETHEVPFGDLVALETILSTRKIAALVLEPLQGEAGIVPPPPGYLAGAEKLCHRFGTLFVLDEVQTGIGRTGTFITGQREKVQPDMVVLAKALSGGLVPVAAVLMRDDIYHSVYGSLKKAIIHTSTYSENGLAMRAGLATLDVLRDEELTARAERLGVELRAQLTARLSRFEMVEQVRGLGLLNGIVMRPPTSLRLQVPFQTFRTIHPAMFGQMLVMRLFQHHNILAQICGNNAMVLKVAPPLVVTEAQLEQYLAGMEAVMEAIHSSSSFWSDALSLAQRAVRI